MDAEDPAAPVDGRVARGQRNRSACVLAFLELVGTGRLKVTGDDVAERAQVSRRAFWTHFKDLEELYEEASLLTWDRYLAEHAPVAADLPLDARLGAWVEQRATELEALAPYARAAALREPFSPALRASRRRFVDAVVADVDRLFVAELAAAARPGPVRSVLVASATYPTWSMWRHDLGLTVGAASAALSTSLRSTLAQAAGG